LFLESNANYGDINLKLREDHDPMEELQKLCNIINGFKQTKDGTLVPIEGHKPRRIKIKER
jgi:hypothetical protein